MYFSTYLIKNEVLDNEKKEKYICVSMNYVQAINKKREIKL